MTEVTEEEFVEAQKVISSYSKQKQDKKEADKIKILQSLIGRFFTKTTIKDDQRDIYRILKDSWHDSQVAVEHWKYYHHAFYQMSRDTWYNDQRELYDKEITEVEFYQTVSWILNKINASKAINMETNH